MSRHHMQTGSWGSCVWIQLHLQRAWLARQASADPCFKWIEQKLGEKGRRQMEPIRGGSFLHKPLPCLSAFPTEVPSSWKGFSVVLCRDLGLLHHSQASTCCFAGWEMAVAFKDGAWCIHFSHTYHLLHEEMHGLRRQQHHYQESPPTSVNGLALLGGEGGDWGVGEINLIQCR